MSLSPHRPPGLTSRRRTFINGLLNERTSDIRPAVQSQALIKRTGLRRSAS